eukprot:scaffold387586_cov17-Prasinocladus_malaysianus.AAC.1
MADKNVNSSVLLFCFVSIPSGYIRSVCIGSVHRFQRLTWGRLSLASPYRLHPTTTGLDEMEGDAALACLHVPIFKCIATSPAIAGLSGAYESFVFRNKLLLYTLPCQITNDNSAMLGIICAMLLSMMSREIVLDQ